MPTTTVASPGNWPVTAGSWTVIGYPSAARATVTGIADNSGVTGPITIRLTFVDDDDPSSPTFGGGVRYQNYQSPERTPEEIEAERVQYEQRIECRRAARVRARALLFEFLDETQRAQYEDDETFYFRGSHGTRYLLTPGTNGNVQWLDAEDNIGGVLCAHPRPYDSEGQRIPDADLHLGQLFALTTNELDWLEVANVHRGRRPEFVVCDGGQLRAVVQTPLPVDQPLPEAEPPPLVEPNQRAEPALHIWCGAVGVA